MTMSPSSSKGTSASSTASTGLPACTISRMRRGRASFAAISSSVVAGISLLPACSATKSVILDVVRLWTTTW